MPVWLKAAGWGGSVLIIIALVITLLKQLIALIGIVTGAIKLLIIIAFVAVFLIVGVLVLKGIQENRKKRE